MKRWLLITLLLIAAPAQAATVSLLGCTFDTNSGTHTVTATPAAGDLVVIFGAGTTNTSATSPTDDNSSGTYTLVTNGFKNSSNDILLAFVRTSLIGSAVSTIFTYAPGASTGGGLCAIAISGMGKVGAAAYRQGAKQSNQTGPATPTPIFSLTPLISNPLLGVVFNEANPAAMTERTGYTELFDNGFNTPTTGLEVIALNSGETSATITWGSSSASNFGVLVIELDSTGAPRPPRSASFGATQ